MEHKLFKTKIESEKNRNAISGSISYSCVLVIYILAFKFSLFKNIAIDSEKNLIYFCLATFNVGEFGRIKHAIRFLCHPLSSLCFMCRTIIPWLWNIIHSLYHDSYRQDVNFTYSETDFIRVNWVYWNSTRNEAFAKASSFTVYSIEKKDWKYVWIWKNRSTIWKLFIHM